MSLTTTRWMLWLALSPGLSQVLHAGTLATFGGSPATLDFGNVAVNTTATSNIDLSVDSGYSIFSASGSGIDSPFSFNFAGCALGNGGFPGPGTCSVTETFAPVSLGPVSAQLNIVECPTLGGRCLETRVNLTANVISLFAEAPAAVDFGAVAIGNTATNRIHFQVDTGYRVFSAQGGGIDIPFSFSFGSCAVTTGGFTGPGACEVFESFTPSAIGRVKTNLILSECPTAGGRCINTEVALLGDGFQAPEPGSFWLAAGVIAVAIRGRRFHKGFVYS